MADQATEFLKATEVWLISRLRRMTESAWGDAVSLLTSIDTFDTDARRTRFLQLKADLEASAASVDDIRVGITKLTDVIRRMVAESSTDLDQAEFDDELARRVAVRVGTGLAAADEAYSLVATHLAKGPGGTVDEVVRTKLVELWNPWTKPWKNLASSAANLLNRFGSWLLDVDDLVGKLGRSIELTREGTTVQLVAKVVKSGTVALPKGPAPLVTLDQVSFEAFLEFSEREVVNPTDTEKLTLIQRGDKWYRGDQAILGLRFRSVLQPSLTKDPLLTKVLPGAEAPKTTSVTAVSLDTAQGLYIGDGRGGERAVLPVRWSFPGVELREVAFGLVRSPKPDADVTGFDLTLSIAAKLGGAVGAQVIGAGFAVDLDGVAEQAELPVSLRWPDQVGLRIKAGPITGGGFIQRIERTYTVNGQPEKRIEFGGVFQLKLFKFGVAAIVILSPDPFSLVLVIGVRFPVPIELSWGFTLNGIGGILALDRSLDLEALKKGMKEHVLDKMLFPDNAVTDAPKLLDSVANIFPPRSGGFVVGPIVELGWGSQAKFVELKLGIVLALPDPMVVILGSLRVRVPSKELPITDVKADLFVAITPDYLLLFASIRDSTIAGFKVAGDLGLYIQWSGSGGFELSVGGFHPEYEKLTGQKPKLGELDRVSIDLSPSSAVKFVIKAYFAVTAGAVMLGVEGRLDADFKVITAKAWLILDMIFIWSPRFGFKVSIEVGVQVELFGATFCDVVFRGSLAGPTQFELAGHIKVDVWFLPTFDEDLGPITWGDKGGSQPQVDARQIVASALKEDEAWKAVLPEHAAQLVTLDAVDGVPGILAHPLAGLEVSQSQVPLGVKISHIGASPVTADMVLLGQPTTDDRMPDALSELRTPFPPGHFFDLEGEQLLARSGFEELQGGCRIAAATTPTAGSSATEEVAYRTYVKRPDGAAVEHAGLKLDRYGAIYVAASSVGRAAKEAMSAVNPYLPKSPGHPPVDVAPLGASALADAASGAVLLSSLGALTATEAALVGAAVNAAGLAETTRIAVRG